MLLIHRKSILKLFVPIFLLSILVGPTLSSAGQEGSAVSEANLRKTVSWLQSLGNRSTWEKQRQTVDWALVQLKTLGFETREQSYDFAGKTWVNVVGIKKGTHPAEAGILLIAHLDSTTRASDKSRAPGADDNGSGVAVLLETARVLSGETVNRPVHFCFFSNEESGSVGSKAFVKEFKNQGGRLLAAINLDVLGYNRPEGLVPWEAISSQDTLKYKTKALWRGLRNAARSWSAEKDTVKVAGREPNRKLVLAVAEALKKNGGISATPLVSKDCG